MTNQIQIVEMIISERHPVIVKVLHDFPKYFILESLSSGVSEGYTARKRIGRRLINIVLISKNIVLI